MQGLKEMLVEEQKYLEKIADAARKSSLIVPEGRLRISKSKYNPRYDMIPSSRTQKYKNLLGGILCPEKVKLMQ